jgi:hypothetical protein
MQACLDLEIPPIHGSSSPGPGSTRWTKSAAQARVNCSATARSPSRLGDEVVLKADRDFFSNLLV